MSILHPFPSGGGSGHEPAHAGYVGRGMLSAAVCGEIFASPSAEAVLVRVRHSYLSEHGCDVLHLDILSLSSPGQHAYSLYLLPYLHLPCSS
jgi:hypothetical protein